MAKKKFRLSNLELDEISLVDQGANQHASVVLTKRAPCLGAEKKECPSMMGDDDDLEKAPPKGVQFVIGFKESGGSEIQSVIFDTDEWDEEAAQEWLEAHDLKSDKVDRPESGNTLRYRQKDPSAFTRFRVITPGKQLSKALRAGQSWQRTQNLVDAALREKFQPPMKPGEFGVEFIYIRDLFRDSVVFEQAGKVYRVDYELSEKPDGELAVVLGEKVPVEVVYQDVGKSNPSAPEPTTIVPEVQIQLGLLKAKAALLKSRLQKFNSCHSPQTGRFCSGGGGGTGVGGGDGRGSHFP